MTETEEWVAEKRMRKEPGAPVTEEPVGEKRRRKETAALVTDEPDGDRSVCGRDKEGKEDGFVRRRNWGLQEQIGIGGSADAVELKV